MSQPPARARRRTPKTTDITPGTETSPCMASSIEVTTYPQAVDTDTLWGAGPVLAAKKPLWQKLVDDLRARIESGELAPGQLIPSEADMITAYGASRPTIRRAVAALRSVGLVVTEHGRGTRVRPSLTGRPANTAISFNPTVIKDAGTSAFTTWEATGWAEVDAPTLYRTTVADYSELLRLSPGEPTFVHERRLEHLSSARILHRLYLPFALTITLPSLSTAPVVTPASLYETLTDAGYSLRWEDTVHAQMPTPNDNASLDIPEGVPMLIHTRVTVAADGTPLALEETRLPADRASIITRPVQ